MPFIVWSTLLSLTYFILLLVMVELGRLWGQKRLSADPDKGLSGTGAIEGPVLGLYGLLIAFSFGGAMSRFDERRSLVIEEANIVQTAWLRLDILPAADLPDVRQAFKTYLDVRLVAYQSEGLSEETMRRDADARKRKQELWDRVILVLKRDGFSSPGTALLSSLNDMFNIGEKRMNVRRKHTPAPIFVLLYGLGLVGALMAGMGLAESKRLNILYAIGFAFINALTVHFILDIEYPRQGMIRVDAIDQVLIDLMNRIR